MILAKKKVSVIAVAPSFSFSLAQEYSLLFFSREKLEISLLRHLPCGLRCNEGQVKTSSRRRRLRAYHVKATCVSYFHILFTAIFRTGRVVQHI